MSRNDEDDKYLKGLDCEPKLIHNVPMDVRAKDSFVRKAISMNALCVFEFPEWRENKQYIMHAVQTHKTAFAHVKPPLCYDTSIIKSALRTSGMNLGKVLSKYRDDEEMVSIALKSDGKSFQYASERLRSDDSLVKMALANTPSAIEWVGSPTDEHVLMALEGEYWSAIQYGSSSLRSDPAVVMKALVEDPSLICHVLYKDWIPRSTEYEFAVKCFRKLKMKRAREER